ncbi:hypothetical protein POM88_030622 [Heracleum sosnowskyi]|uniref:RNase H type-1 domain-containing protein n=1 Tax=Heracleum sosnowskyi TaxID=360622 RepID=A0AAD8HX74_9APIA|nr:hypothetical protein POM88_030622 [Heracleum sosnowskyi]
MDLKSWLGYVLKHFSAKAALVGSGDNQQLEYWIESDCQLAVRAVRTNVTIYSPFGGIIDDCRRLLASLSNVNIAFVKRSGNMATDWQFAKPRVLGCILHPPTKLFHIYTHRYLQNLCRAPFTDINPQGADLADLCGDSSGKLLLLRSPV